MSTDPASRLEPMARPKSKDFVIRDGFPALRNEQGEPWIEGDEPLPRAPFLSYTSALDLADSQTTMELDCATVFSARAKEGQAAYSAGCTYFAPAVMKPRCGLEALALQIFQAHTQELPKGSFVPGESGAEWWTLVLGADPPKEESESGDDDGSEQDEDHDEVGMHFDADYGLEDQAPGLMLHPRVATITYLSDVGAPTLILDKRSPPPHNVKELEGEISRGWLSGPRIGKHVAFDGRLLHGAPATFFPGIAPGDTLVEDETPPTKKQKANDGVASIPKPEKAPQRITFMVNVWLNHCPLDAELLDDDIVEQLKTPSDNKSNLSLKTQDSLLDEKSIGVYAEDPAGEEETVICDRVVTLFYNEKMEKQHAISQDAAKNGKSYELQFAKGSLRLEVGAIVEE